MSSRFRVALASATALIALGAAAAPASATEMQPMSKHTGTAGCFNWSWADGDVTTTVYFHNTCKRAEWIDIIWTHGGGEYEAPYGAGEKGSYKDYGAVKSITDMGPWTG
ncbi:MULTISPECIES: hypothetical protein [unclassified Streptomyces]|uniref:hypothetical protein n=1 Tax=unclassified Streptomyces TaxID=2593676 RepID=UPI000F4D93B7|nr:hypothetical protein [Streptomyces sp. Ag109_O5-1]RPE42567.1 hypothetical protein EDD90_5708 [Streptomyces sp. Ag109_O5-1]